MFAEPCSKTASLICMSNSWLAGWSKEASPGMTQLSSLWSLVFQEAILESFIWWCQDSKKWQERASPNMQTLFKSLVASHFSVVPLVKVSPKTTPRVYWGDYPGGCIQEGNDCSQFGKQSTQQPILSQPPFPSPPAPVLSTEHMVGPQYVLAELN